MRCWEIQRKFSLVRSLQTKRNVMSDERSSQPVGEPEPMESEEWSSILARIGSVIGVSVFGITVFAMLNFPVRARGSTRSAKLKWEEHRRTVQADAADIKNTGNAPHDDCPASSDNGIDKP